MFSDYKHWVFAKYWNFWELHRQQDLMNLLLTLFEILLYPFCCFFSFSQLCISSGHDKSHFYQMCLSHNFLSTSLLFLHCFPLQLQPKFFPSCPNTFGWLLSQHPAFCDSSSEIVLLLFLVEHTVCRIFVNFPLYFCFSLSSLCTYIDIWMTHQAWTLLWRMECHFFC